MKRKSPKWKSHISPSSVTSLVDNIYSIKLMTSMLTTSVCRDLVIVTLVTGSWRSHSIEIFYIIYYILQNVSYRIISTFWVCLEYFQACEETNISKMTPQRDWQALTMFNENTTFFLDICIKKCCYFINRFLSALIVFHQPDSMFVNQWCCQEQLYKCICSGRKKNPSKNKLQTHFSQMQFNPVISPTHL